MTIKKFNSASRDEYLKRTNKNEVIEDYLEIGGDKEDVSFMTKIDMYEEMVMIVKDKESEKAAVVEEPTVADTESKEVEEKPTEDTKKKKSVKSKRKSTKKSSKKKSTKSKKKSVKKKVDFDTLFGDMDPLEVVLKQGILVKVDSHCWWGKSSRVPKEMLNNAPKKILKGVQTLIDGDHIAPLNSIRQKGERVVIKNGFPFIGLRGVYFVPKACIETVDDGLTECQAEFAEARTAFMSDFSKYKKEWATFCKKEGVTAPPDEWYPDKYELENKFKFSWLMFPFSPPNEETGVLSERQFTAEVTKQRKKMAEFLSVSLSTLAIKFEEIVSKLNERLSKGETIKPKTISSLKGFVETFNQMNVTGNTDLSTLVERMDKVIGSKSAKDINKSDSVRDKMSTKMGKLVSRVGKLIDSDDKFTRSLDF